MGWLDRWDRRNVRLMGWLREHPEAGTAEYDERAEWRSDADYRRHAGLVIASIVIPFAVFVAVTAAATAAVALVLVTPVAGVLLGAEVRHRRRRSLRPWK